MNKLVDLDCGIIAKIDCSYGKKTNLPDGIYCECKLIVDRITFIKERYFYDAETLTLDQFKTLRKEIEKIDNETVITTLECYNNKLPF